MFAFFKNRKIRKEKERQEDIAADKEQEAKAELSLEVYKKNMLSSPCPINHMHNCKEECVHFAGGYTCVMPDFYSGWFYYVEAPKCKLWAAR